MTTQYMQLRTVVLPIALSVLLVVLLLQLLA
jgi:hypothetical protein